MFKQLLILVSFLFIAGAANAALCSKSSSFTVNGVTSSFNSGVIGVDGDRCRKYASNDINLTGGEMGGCAQQASLYARNSASVSCTASMTHTFIKNGNTRWSQYSARTFTCYYSPNTWYGYVCY